MKLFEMPQIEVVKFSIENIITTSTEEDFGFFTNPCF